VNEPVTIGTAIVAYIEPEPGRERAFNAWYERDHFYAAAMAGPGMYAGGRWVATGACKAARPGASLFGDPARGSYLATYWVLPGMQAEWDEWAARQYAAMPPERLFEGREHLHTALYRYAWDVRAEAAPAPATALDHGFAGVIVIATSAPAERWSQTVVAADAPLAVGFVPERVIMTTTNPGPYSLTIVFCADDPLIVWPRVAPSFDDLGDVGFASAFLRTIPGTDAYVDEL
jgi:hypothetical protein